jgi:glycosyltransferase involved in cell wall biosynthesis
MRNVVLWPVKGWFSIRLPLELKLRPVDLFLGLSQALPRLPSQTKTIGLVHDLGFLHYPDAYPGSLQKLKHQTEHLVECADRIISVSEYVKNDIVSRYNRTKNTIIAAHPGVDDRFTLSGDAFIGSNPYFLFVGALKPGKNVPILLESFARFLQLQKKTYDLYLAGGDFWKDERIEMMIQKYDLSHRVRLLGYVPDNELPEYYRGAIAFVTPSLHEGFCLPAVEAMASGCPVIVSTAGALPEIVDGAGISVDPNNVKGFVDTMTMVSQNKRKRSAMIEKGIKHVKNFSWETFAKTVYQVIQSIHET